MHAEIATKDVHPSVMTMVVTDQAWHWPVDFVYTNLVYLHGKSIR